MEIIFIGGFFPEQLELSILAKSKLQVQNAANVFQWAFIRGLEQNLNRPIKLVTAPFIGWYPRYYKDLIVKTAYFSNHSDSDAGVMVGFLNLPIVKNVFKLHNLISSIDNFISSEKKNVLIVYSLDSVYLKAAVKIKTKYPETIICVIITDLPEIDFLPEFKDDTSIFLRSYIDYIEKPKIYKLLCNFDCFVVLADKMIDFLKIDKKPWLRVEGIYNDESELQLNIPLQDKKIKVVLYTGSVNFSYGINQLLDAFKLIKSVDFRLWICGGGGGADLVRSRAIEDKRIEYFGIVSREKVAELQANATLLVNPRNTLGEYNKYSFPSKTIEYLASGTPTLIFKLEGIPSEYFDYCYTVEDNTVQSLADAIYSTCQFDPITLRSKGNSARDFILKNKTAKMQCNKVLKMISSL